MAQPIDENVEEPLHVLLPTRLVVHVAHADKGTKQVFRADIVTDFARRDRPVQESTDSPRQPVK
jgi:hypothetical protein